MVDFAELFFLMLSFGVNVTWAKADKVWTGVGMCHWMVIAARSQLW